MSLYIISDLHIWGPDDPLYYSLISILRNRTRSGDTLVLAGDIFDFFVGDKAVLKDRYSGFISELRLAGSRGVKTHYIEGNHDFLLKKTFGEVSGLEVHPSEVRFQIAGKSFLVAHGDLADKSDHGYRMLRGFFRSPLIRAFVRLAPGNWVDAIGKKSSETSRKKNPRLPTSLSTERIVQLRKTYRNYAAERLTQGYDYIVMGHCHDLDEMKFTIGERSAQYINVGYPRSHGSFLSWNPGDEVIQREAIPT